MLNIRFAALRPPTSLIAATVLMSLPLSAWAQPPKKQSSFGLPFTADLVALGSRLIGQNSLSKQILGTASLSEQSKPLVGQVNAALPISAQFGASASLIGPFNLSTPISVSMPFNAPLLDLSFQFGRNEQLEDLERRRQKLIERLDGERNALLRSKVEIDRKQLETDIQRLQQANNAFRFQNERLLRKESYDVPTDKLVVVVADFSSGEVAQGREIADEIFHHLQALKKQKIDIYPLAGEIAPGVIIRSETMARDIGNHFPIGTNFAVIWGTMSPQTVGQFRPHVTCVQKSSVIRDNAVTGDGEVIAVGLSANYSIDLEASTLPWPDDPEDYRRECFRRLIGAACAAIPRCYAAHEIGRGRVPELDMFYEFVGGDSPAAQDFRVELDPLIQWPRIRRQQKAHHLRAMSAVAPHLGGMPQFIHNAQDGSVMSLITESDGKPFYSHDDSGRKVVTYIDVIEISNRQFVRFLNENGQGNHVESGASWIKLDESFFDIESDSSNTFRVKAEDLQDIPVIDVTWYGARRYCRWAAKELPTLKEWSLAAAMPEKLSATHPFGKGFGPRSCNSGLDDGQVYYAAGGTFPRDCSRISCYDMAGNVSEWLKPDSKRDLDAKKMVAGGNWMDKDSEAFRIDAIRTRDQSNAAPWIGFRGVVRVPVDESPE